MQAQVEVLLMLVHNMYVAPSITVDAYGKNDMSATDLLQA